MENIIIVILLLLIVGGAIAYIVRERRRGNKCIGCPDSKNCSKGKGCGCCNH